MFPNPAHRLAACQRPPGRPVMRQRWEGLLFLHWPANPALVQERLPQGLYVDTYNGQAWLGIVPFFMERVRPTGLPPLPWLSWFHELNVRTYVYDEQGNPGVWFFSLDCNQPIAVEIARRGFHLPYEHAVMSSVKSGNGIRFTSQRKSPGARIANYDYELPTTTQATVPGTLEWFLVERYLLFSSNPDNALFCGRVHHAPYQIAAAVSARGSTEPLRLNGFPEPLETPASQLVAAPVDVSIFPLRRFAPSRRPRLS